MIGALRVKIVLLFFSRYLVDNYCLLCLIQMHTNANEPIDIIADLKKGRHFQGGHALWKTGKMVKNSLQGKIREFEIFLKIREKSENLKKSYLCKVKIFKFYSCSDVATGGFFLPYA